MMTKENLWADAARSGAILGLILSASLIVENMLTFSGKFSLILLSGVVSLAVAILHYYLLHRYTRQRARLYSAEEGFSFGKGYSFILLISAFSGIITGAVTYIYQYIIIGYSSYIDRMSEMIRSVMQQAGPAAAALKGQFSNMVSTLQNTPEPSLLDVISGGIINSILFGLIFGLFIAGILSRPHNPFGESQNRDNTPSENEANKE